MADKGPPDEEEIYERSEQVAEREVQRSTGQIQRFVYNTTS